MERIISLVKKILFIIVGTLLFVFFKYVKENINYVISSIILMYGVLGLLECIAKKEYKSHLSFFVFNILLITIGTIVFFLKGAEYFAYVCIISAVWSIIREEYEIADFILRPSLNIILRILGLIESVVVIVFSIILIFNPTMHHAEIHYILLGVELILTVLLPMLNKLLFKENKTNENSN